MTKLKAKKYFYEEETTIPGLLKWSMVFAKKFVRMMSALHVIF